MHDVSGISSNAIGRHLDELDWLTTKLEDREKVLIRISLDDDRTRKLMSVAGISSVIATAVIASIGDISRFQSPEKLASYFGFTPRVRQSGERSAIHGRISKQGNATARTMLIEAAWGAASVSGPLRAFFLRVKDRKGANVAAVATARKIANLIWHLLTKEEPYQWARPAFVAMKMRKLELRAGAPKAHGKAGPGRDYWIKELRHREMELVANAEAAYAKMVEAWRDRPPKPKETSKKGLFNNIRIQFQKAVFQIAAHFLHAAKGVADGFGQIGFSGNAVQLGVQPEFQIIKDRFGIALTQGAPLSR